MKLQLKNDFNLIKPNRFIIRYMEQQPVITSHRMNKSTNVSEKKYTSLGSQLQLGHKQFKLTNRPVCQTQISTSNCLSRKKPIPLIRRSQSIDIFEQTDEQQKQYNRVPIQYYDQAYNVIGVERSRARVVYRGYAPKNTYFYLKTIKELKFKSTPNAIKGRNEQITFNSKFQSGNLLSASRVSNKQYWLYMREDTNTHGLRQWYFFEVKNNNTSTIKFRIYKFSKHYSLYKEGLKPFIKVGNSQWKQAGQKIAYQYDQHQKCFYLQFEYTFQVENGYTYFATLPPYSYTTLLQFLHNIKQLHPEISIKRLGQSLAGLDIPLIEIKNLHEPIKKQDTSKQKQNKQPRQVIFIMARTHPGQTVSNFALQSLIQKILLEPKLKYQYDWIIIPMINPDGVLLGNHRTGALGIDLNRSFQNLDLDTFPQIALIIGLINTIMKKQTIKFLIDLHGHSAKRNIFAYGEQHQLRTDRYYYSRILPKLLSNTISSFKYDHCVFRACKQKKNTARVFFSNKFKINSITFEQSYGLLSQGSMGIHNWKNFGTAIGDALILFIQMDDHKDMSIIKQYLHEQLLRQQQRVNRRLARQKKLLNIKKIQKSVQINHTEQEEKINYSQKFQQSRSTDKLDIIIPQQQVFSEEQDKSSINSSELSSGDEDLECNQQQLQGIKKQLVRVGCMKEGFKRDLYSMHDKKLELVNWDRTSQPRLHQYKANLGPRLLKLQMKKKQPQKMLQLPSIRR